MTHRTGLTLAAAITLVFACSNQRDEVVAGGVPETAPPEPTAAATARPPAPAAPAPPAAPPLPWPPGPRGGQGAGEPTATAGEWTTGIVADAGLGAGVAVLEEVRAARHDDLDRVVFGFSPVVPGYHLEYVDRPVRQCGSGDPVPLPGDAWLEVRLEPAAAHTDAGEPTVGREVPVALENVRRVVLTCDFEAVVTWVLAVGSPNSFRVSVLADPPRLVVDVRH
jgi:hypothetical protein